MERRPYAFRPLRLRLTASQIQKIAKPTTFRSRTSSTHHAFHRNGSSSSFHSS